ncbi:DUF1178 family protein [Limnohabitans sp.]|uniref:DUF1178 family protein n=1 Tax=Limnohabitans sp. TaxID=1907725 RepID=UPI00286F1DD6|nr:DUF1178 family protein [Limnohabitans sp.]
MKVLDLQCGQHHVFEGWFGSEDDFQSQRTRGLVSCPMCGDAQVTKKLSAPRLNLSTVRGEREAHGTAPSPAVESASAPMPTTPPALPTPQDVASIEPAQLQAAFLTMVRHMVRNTQDVGHKFPEEARKMHYGEAEQRNIRGHATPEETEALIEEGIAVMPLPLPDVFKEPWQ